MDSFSIHWLTLRASLNVYYNDVQITSIVEDSCFSPITRLIVAAFTRFYDFIDLKYWNVVTAACKQGFAQRYRE